MSTGLLIIYLIIIIITSAIHSLLVLSVTFEHSDQASSVDCKPFSNEYVHLWALADKFMN